MKELIVLVGPPGSGKSTFANGTLADFVRINQDDQGKKEHIQLFMQALSEGKDIVIDRMNFSKSQRAIYLNPAKEHGYTTEIVVFHENNETCLKRMAGRENHPTINDQETAQKVLNFFYSKYERVEDGEADHVTRVWPAGVKQKAIYSDLDGTLCDVEHRRHFVRTDGQKKDWRSFFLGIPLDPIKPQVEEVLRIMVEHGYHIVYCTGRSDQYKTETTDWLKKHYMWFDKSSLYMRLKSDSRTDYITKEVLLDFEVLTRFNVFFCLDDRNQVVEMLRKRGLTVFQVADGNF